MPPAEAAALPRLVARVQELVPPGEPIYVAPRRSDLVTISDPLIHFLVRRPNVLSRDVSVQALPREQALTVAALRRTRPKAVVRWTDPASSRPEPNRRGRPSGSRALDEYLASAYRLDARYGAYDVLVRAGGRDSLAGRAGTDPPRRRRARGRRRLRRGADRRARRGPAQRPPVQPAEALGGRPAPRRDSSSRTPAASPPASGGRSCSPTSGCAAATRRARSPLPARPPAASPRTPRRGSPSRARPARRIRRWRARRFSGCASSCRRCPRPDRGRCPAVTRSRG